MSNKRKLRAAGPAPAERCTSCGRRIGKGMDALRHRTGQVTCPKCGEHGELPRLPCGHVALPGTLIITDSDDRSNYQCAVCSPYAALYGNQRLGMARRQER